MATLHLVCGLPGSGKTTLAKRLEKELGAIRFSPDDGIIALGGDLFDTSLRKKIEKLQLDIALKKLRQGKDVVLENGFWTRAERDQYRAAATSAGARARLHYLDVPLEEIKRRVEVRNRMPGEIPIPLENFESWVPCFETPSADETN